MSTISSENGNRAASKGFKISEFNTGKKLRLAIDKLAQNGFSTTGLNVATRQQVLLNVSYKNDAQWNDVNNDVMVANGYYTTKVRAAAST